MNTRILSFLAVLACGTAAAAAPLPARWDELTGPDFKKALKKAEGVCLLPMGSIERNGPAEPLGTNMLVVRSVVDEATKRQYAIIFPDYAVGTTNDLSHLPGTIAYSGRLQREMLKETVDEMGRNGCTKILIVNGHGTNNWLIQEFIRTDLDEPRDYVVYAVSGNPPSVSASKPESANLPKELLPSKPAADGHGGEERTAVLMATHPELAHPERARDEPAGVESGRDPYLPTGAYGVQTGFAGVVSSPTGYFGDPSGATEARGKALLSYTADRVAEAIRAVRADKRTPAAQRTFFEGRRRPVR